VRLVIIAAVLAVAILVAVAAQAASAHASRSHVFGWGGGPKPTIVLEHGAWADASSWDKVILQLQEDGFTVYAPPNPLRGVS
jgi:pimeloyl-ACP methyl ester carboxylesterase